MLPFVVPAGATQPRAPAAPILNPAIAEGPGAVHPKGVGECFKSGVSALPHGRGKTASHCSPRAPSCYGRLHRVLHLANQRTVTLFHTHSGGSVPRAAGTTPSTPSRRNSSQGSDGPRHPSVALPRASPRPRGSRYCFCSRSLCLLARGIRRGTAASSPPLDGKKTHQAAGKVCARPRSARNSRWPGARTNSPALQPPRRSQGSHHLLPPGRGGGGGGLGGKARRTSPSVPHSPPPVLWKGVSSAPGSVHRRLLCSG